MNTVKILLAISAICLYAPVPANAQWADVEPQRPQPAMQRQVPSAEQKRQALLERLQQLKLQSESLGTDQLKQGPFLTEPEPVHQEQPQPQNFQLPPGTRLPGMSEYQQTNAFTDPSGIDRSTAFFNGITPKQAAEAQYVEVDLSDHGALRSPDWAKQKVKIRQFTDVTEQHGNQDSLGFF